MVLVASLVKGYWFKRIDTNSFYPDKQQTRCHDFKPSTYSKREPLFLPLRCD